MRSLTLARSPDTVAARAQGPAGAPQPHDSQHDGPQGQTEVLERPKLSQPPLYGVLLLNDDYTPMEFVVHVLLTATAMRALTLTRSPDTVAARAQGPAGAPQPHDSQHDGPQGQTEVLERPKLSQPPLYGVLLLNDDYTPMEFVVHVLQKFFHMENQQATQVMLQVHREGRGLCGMFPRDVAETYTARINAYARRNDYPLLSEVEVGEEPDDDAD